MPVRTPMPPTHDTTGAGPSPRPETLTSALPADIPPSDELPPERPMHAQEADVAPQMIQWTVEDSNAKQKDAKGVAIPRIHDIGLETGPVTLYGLGRPTPMPVHVAMKFLVDSAFIVRNERGERVNSVTRTTTRPSDGAVLLQPGQIVAAFHELTEDALRSRAAVLPGANPSFVTFATREQLLTAIAQNDLQQRRIPVGNEDARTLAEAPGAGALQPVTESWLDRVMPRPNAA